MRRLFIKIYNCIQRLFVGCKFNHDQEEHEFEMWFYEQMKEDN